jgi:uncharacterized protein YjiS (DUF1127 family)
MIRLRRLLARWLIRLRRRRRRRRLSLCEIDPRLLQDIGFVPRDALAAHFGARVRPDPARDR